MTQLIAMCRIYRAPKEGPLTEMMGYDPDGNPIVRATHEQILPGEFFEESDAAEEAWLIANDAAREPTPREIEVREQLLARGVGR